MNVTHKIIWNGLLLLLVFVTYKSSLVLGVPSKLKGAYAQETKGDFTSDEYFNGKAQAKFDRLSQQNFFGHDLWVTLHNEWDYRIWNHLNVHEVVVGEDGYLFEQSYIDNLYGIHRFAQMERLEERKENIVFTDSLLKTKSKQLVFLLMPAKSFLYPDKISGYKNEFVPDKHIHDDFLKFAKANEIKVLNFLDYFQNHKLGHPAFPKQGIHLSKYAETMVLDSLLSFLEAETALDLYDYEFTDIEMSQQPRGRDDDIGQVLNLINPIPLTEELAYREFKFNRVDTLNTPDVLVIGDSSFWGIYPNISNYYLFGNHEFWYRKNEMFSIDITTQMYTDPQICLASIEKFDYVFIMINNTDVDFVGWNYFEKVKSEFLKGLE